MMGIFEDIWDIFIFLCVRHVRNTFGIFRIFLSFYVCGTWEIHLGHFGNTFRIFLSFYVCGGVGNTGQKNIQWQYPREKSNKANDIRFTIFPNSRTIIFSSEKQVRLCILNGVFFAFYVNMKDVKKMNQSEHCSKMFYVNVMFNM